MSLSEKLFGINKSPDHVEVIKFQLKKKLIPRGIKFNFKIWIDFKKNMDIFSKVWVY